MLKDKNEFPLVMKARDVAEAMGISKRNAYHVMSMPDFPVIRINKMMMVYRESFFVWLERVGGVEAK